jgi:hypothetical protein
MEGFFVGSLFGALLVAVLLLAVYLFIPFSRRLDGIEGRHADLAKDVASLDEIVREHLEVVHGYKKEGEDMVVP